MKNSSDIPTSITEFNDRDEEGRKLAVIHQSSVRWAELVPIERDQVSFAIVDLETTGLSVQRHHRIIEIGVVIANSSGQITGEWETLINPEREIDATEIHGLTNADLFNAPTFKIIAGELKELLAGKILVAHNLSFDAAFLANEFARINYATPIGPLSGLCTMKLAPQFLANHSRSLAACCESVGYQMGHAHAALDDARASANLLKYYLRQSPKLLDEWQELVDESMGFQWQTLEKKSHPVVTRATKKHQVHSHFLQRLAIRSPRSNLYPEANSYLEVLDRALIDQYLSNHEIEELIEVANSIGLSRDEAHLLHNDYLCGLVRIALEDGNISEEEHMHLAGVAKCLNISQIEYDEALKNGANKEPLPIHAFKLKVGDTLVFTGDAEGFDRDELTHQGKMLGLKITASVSKKTDLVVSEDPDSLSSKARKARELRIPIVDYKTYFEMLNRLS
jgi:DNA polymerase-3 subunit epsilon